MKGRGRSKAARGEIVDRNGVVLATNRTVCTISVIHSQIKDPQQTADMLSKELELDREDVLKKVEKVSSMEKIRRMLTKRQATVSVSIICRE
mgnify:CR=1 FL=1